MAVADREDRIVVTKDGDFLISHLLRDLPHRLLHVTTGNIADAVLLNLFNGHLTEIEAAFQLSTHVELTGDAVIAHGRHQA